MAFSNNPIASFRSSAVRLLQKWRPFKYRSCASELAVVCGASGDCLRSLGRSASAMECASSSSTAKTLFSSRSYVFDQRWYPSGALISWAVSRSTLPLTAQLINAADGYHLWSKTYDRELKSVFAVEDELAHSIADALRPKL